MSQNIKTLISKLNPVCKKSLESAAALCVSQANYNIEIEHYLLKLLDEIEKAHPDVIEVFYPVFDKGTMEDSEGLKVDFKNTIILMTCNIGGDEILEAFHPRQSQPDVDRLVEILRPVLLLYFKLAFLDRLVILPYITLCDDEIRQITHLKLSKIQQRFWQNHRAKLSYDDKLVSAIVDRCSEVDSGARNVNYILSHHLLPELAGKLLEKMAAGEPFSSIRISLSETGTFIYNLE